jgi:CheY-like chemotaxis protein
MMTVTSNAAGVATILVGEDEPLLRLAAVDLVETAGYTALAAADATEAVNILEARADIRIVFTDIDMPRGVDGLQLAAIIRDRWPPIKVILVSGHLEDPGHMIAADTAFFTKPYCEEQIVETIRQMLR